MDQEAKAKYYRHLADECARTASGVPEQSIREAYFDLQRRWLQLAAEAEELDGRRRVTGA